MADEVKEFVGHYANCWGLIKPDPESKEIPCCIRELVDDRRILVNYLKLNRPSRTSDEVLVAYDYLKKEGTWYLPECRFFNGRETAGFFNFRPTRQFLRGLTPSLGQISMLHGNLDYAPRFKSDIDMIWHWTKPLPSFQEVFRAIMNGERVGGAFSNNFAITAFKGFDLPIVYHKTFPIGKMVDDRTVELIPGAMMYKEFLENTANLRVRKMVDK